MAAHSSILAWEIPWTEEPGGSSCGSCSLASVVSNSLQPHELSCAGFLCPWDSPGKNTGNFSYPVAAHPTPLKSCKDDVTPRYSDLLSQEVA